MKIYSLLPAGTFAMAVLLATSANPAYASDADVCYQAAPSHPLPGPMMPAQMSKLTSKTVFDCPRAGTHTLPELAQDGWTIVAVQPVAADGGMKWMAVVQKK